jgi:hypothetical protein
MHDSELGPVVDHLYEAAVRPELWRRPALDRLARASNALGAQMLYRRRAGAALHTVSSGLEEISEAFFREGWHINNSREVRARARRVGLQEVITESDLFTPEDLTGIRSSASSSTGLGCDGSAPSAPSTLIRYRRWC